MSYKDASNKKCSENIIYLEWKNIKNDIFIKFKTKTRMTQKHPKTKNIKNLKVHGRKTQIKIYKTDYS